ncbi:D-proline reductase (dithiol) proprotein PrdA [Caproiciproducens sp. R1]|uniref:D-proline reductase (dithiol) proprotein PrdA n=1 Tax=Caproiciproducens sp. R1 TaxID=3435000 RepID=UPI004034A267
MSMTTETLKANLKEPAIFCCRRRRGTVISAADLEDPSLFDDMAEAGLLTLSGDALTVEEALGATLLADCEALTPILPSMVEGARKTEKEKAERPAPVETGEPAGTSFAKGASGMMHIEIKSLEGLSLDLPWPGLFPSEAVAAAAPAALSAAVPSAAQGEDKTLRTLTKKYFQAADVVIGEKTSFEDGVLTLDRGLLEKALLADPLVKEIKMDVIKPADRHIYTDTIMDVCPIAAKVSGTLGEGVTHVMEGAVFMLTGVDEDGTQVHEFGSSEGYLDEKMAFGNPGCADENDIIIRVETIIQRHTGMERRGPLAAHKCEDVIIQAARDVLKTANQAPLREEICRDVKKYGRPRVILVKEIMGQGAMHDNILCPNEPCGVTGGQKNVDLGNVPVMLSPNEVLDGGIHALTCIGPSTKEMTRHYFREPLVRALAADEELNLLGVVFVGSPQVNDEKTFVSERLGAWMEALGAEGAIVTTEGFGNNHIDFISHIEQIGKRGIPVVGVSFCAYQGQLVVGNRYADAMIELNKDQKGFENEVAGCSEICPKDALRAVQMLKNKMMGVEIKPAPKKWSQQVVDGNNLLLGL